MELGGQLMSGARLATHVSFHLKNVQIVFKRLQIPFEFRTPYGSTE